MSAALPVTMFGTWIRTLRRNLFGKYLLVTNVVSSGVLLGASDVIQQTIELAGDNNGQKRDWRRTGRMFKIGIITGPFNHYWYRVLDFYLPRTTFNTIVRKIICDQAIASPFFISFFMIGMSMFEGQSLDSSIAELKGKFWDIYKADWAVWPAAQAVNFYFVPSQLRVIYVNTIILGWHAYLSFVKHKDEPVSEKKLLSSEDDRIVPQPTLELYGNISNA